MILWTVKLIGMIRRAIAGRKYPYQLAWAVAFGVLLGIVPHGNLLAVCLLVLVLSLKLNHAMAALTAIAASFLASKLDPVSHAVGEFLLTNPDFASVAQKAWALPMMPWTDLNNTVVLGSTTIGLAALFPIFLVTYPVFRFLAPSAENTEDEFAEDRQTVNRQTAIQQTAIQSGNHAVQTVIVEKGSSRIPSPKHQSPKHQTIGHQSIGHPSNGTQTMPRNGDASEPIHFVEVQPVASTVKPDHPAVETRIDVIRVKESSSASGNAVADQQTGNHSSEDLSNTNQPMDEALNYLLRQLRDSQTRNAA